MAKNKTTPAFLRALGASEHPNEIQLAGNSYQLSHVFKHDFFAATAAYEGPSGKIILKLGRQASILGLPAKWIGRLLAWHEAEAYRRAENIEAVPAFLGRFGPTGIAHAFVEGRPLCKGEPVPDGFFVALDSAIQQLHQRGMAYVDLEKPENVLVGDDGRPYLIDFQIAWFWPWRRGAQSRIVRWVAGKFQGGDRYHLLKLMRRFRPDLMTSEQMAAAQYLPPAIRFHRRFIRPLTGVRRWILNRIDPRRGAGERGRVDEEVSAGKL